MRKPAKPESDLNALSLPKDGDEAPPVATDPAGAKGYAHTLSLRLTTGQYRRLRKHVADQEDKTGKRITHQALIETALNEYLTKCGA